MSNHDKAGEFRRKAEECRCVADQSADPESKTTWLDLASRWLVCAEKVEQMSGSTSATGPTTPIGNTTEWPQVTARSSSGRVALAWHALCCTISEFPFTRRVRAAGHVAGLTGRLLWDRVWRSNTTADANWVGAGLPTRPAATSMRHGKEGSTSLTSAV